jgi:hypothetical protein
MALSPDWTGCDAFTASVSLDDTQAGAVFQWGVIADIASAPNTWVVPTEVPDQNSTGDNVGNGGATLRVNGGQINAVIPAHGFVVLEKVSQQISKGQYFYKNLLTKSRFVFASGGASPAPTRAKSANLSFRPSVRVIIFCFRELAMRLALRFFDQWSRVVREICPGLRLVALAWWRFCRTRHAGTGRDRAL